MTPVALSTVMKQGVQATTLLFLAWCGTPITQAASIRLDDQTNVTGDVVRVEDDTVLIAVPRSHIQSVNGQPLPTPLVEGSTAPLFSVQDFLGRPQTLGAPPHAITVLHFWVSWCPHCRADAPKIQALYDQLKDSPTVRIITVSLDRERSAAQQFITEHQVTYPVIVAAEQAAIPQTPDVTSLYQIVGFPVTFVIDAQGIIRRKLIGSFVESGVDLNKFVNALLASAQGGSSAPTPPAHH